MRRIIITGPAGAGKSRLASELGERLGIPVLHLDAMFWGPGWVPTPRPEWEALQRRELAAESWVVDSQFDDILLDWFEAADTVVFVDASPLRCLWRVGRRRLNREAGVGIPAGTEPAPFHRSLAKFVRNQWRYRASVRREILGELARDLSGRRTVVVRGDADSSRFLLDVDSRSRTKGTL